MNFLGGPQRKEGEKETMGTRRNRQAYGCFVVASRVAFFFFLIFDRRGRSDKILTPLFLMALLLDGPTLFGGGGQAGEKGEEGRKEYKVVRNVGEEEEERRNGEKREWERKGAKGNK